MRQNQTFRVRANHHIPYLGSLHEIPGNGCEFSWTAFDFSENKNEDNRELFAVRFVLPATAERFKNAYEDGQRCNKELMESRE